jgi:hypothetical protein
MTTPRGGRLTSADEWPRHQVARTFDSVASDSPHWSDGYYFTASDDAGTASLFTAIRLYANTDVLDGYACVGIDGRQHNLRWSRRLRPAIDDLAVGPLAVEVLAPLERLRITCAPNPYGISYDLTWTGLHEPYLEAYAERWASGRLTAQRCNYDQCCDLAGWLEVDGRRIEVGGSWVGVRDHSWGLGRTGGPPTPAAAPLPPGVGDRSFAVRQWVMVRFPERVVFWQLHRADDGSFSMFESRVLPRGDAGAAWSYAAPEELELRLIDGTQRLREGTVRLRTPAGGEERFRFTVVGTPVYLQGGGYWQGFDDGLGRGVYRGDDHGEGEVWDVSSPGRVHDPRGLFRARPDAWAETFATFENLDDPAERGTGHLECVVAVAHPGLT